jgi:hypothetical protein
MKITEEYKSLFSLMKLEKMPWEPGELARLTGVFVSFTSGQGVFFPNIHFGSMGPLHSIASFENGM